MMSLSIAVCRIYTPCHSVHLGYLCIVVNPLMVLEDVLRGRDKACFEIHLYNTIEWTQRCTWRPGPSKFGDALGDWVIEWTQRYTWRPYSRDSGDTLGGQDQVNSEMHFEAVIARVGGYNGRPWLRKIGGVLGDGWSGSDSSDSGQSGGSQSGGSESEGTESGGGRSGGMCDGSWDSIHLLTCNWGNVDNWVQQGPPRAGRLAGSEKTIVLGMMQYLVYAVLSVCSIWCIL